MPDTTAPKRTSSPAVISALRGSMVTPTVSGACFLLPSPWQAGARRRPRATGKVRKAEAGRMGSLGMGIP